MSSKKVLAQIIYFLNNHILLHYLIQLLFQMPNNFQIVLDLIILERNQLNLLLLNQLMHKFISMVKFIIKHNIYIFNN